MLANPNRNVARDWEAMKLPELLGKDYVFVSIHEAMRYALVSHLHVAHYVLSSVMKQWSGGGARPVFLFP